MAAFYKAQINSQIARPTCMGGGLLEICSYRVVAYLRRGLIRGGLIRGGLLKGGLFGERTYSRGS